MYKRLFPFALLILLTTLACSIAGTTPTLPASDEPPEEPTSLPPEQPTEAPAEPTNPPTESPTEEPIVSGLLPAPVYFIKADDSQIWRVEMDGATMTQITSESEPVTDFDTSPIDGSLAYVSSNALILTDSLGGNRQILALGPEAKPEDWLSADITAPRWHPYGAQIAYGLNGVAVYLLEIGESRILQPSDPYPTDFNNLPEGPIRFYFPHLWSPDGRYMLVDFSYFPEAGGLTIMDLNTGQLIDVTSPDGIVCCDGSWSADGQSIYFANAWPGMIPAGLWRADVLSGMGVTLVQGESGGNFTLIGHPQQLSDGLLYYFMATTGSFPEGETSLTMTRSAADGVSDRVVLRSDSYIVDDVLWAWDGSGAVIVDVTAGRGSTYPSFGALLWLASDNSLAVTLPARGRLPRWGK